MSVINAKPLFARPGSAPYRGREERRVQGLDYQKHRTRLSLQNYSFVIYRFCKAQQRSSLEIFIIHSTNHLTLKKHFMKPNELNKQATQNDEISKTTICKSPLPVSNSKFGCY